MADRQGFETPRVGSQSRNHQPPPPRARRIAGVIARKRRLFMAPSLPDSICQAQVRLQPREHQMEVPSSTHRPALFSWFERVTC